MIPGTKPWSPVRVCDVWGEWRAISQRKRQGCFVSLPKGFHQRTHRIADALQALLHRVGADAAEARLQHHLLDLLGRGGGGGERDGQRALGGLFPVGGAGLTVQLLGLAVVGSGNLVEALDVPVLRVGVWVCVCECVYV